MITLGTGVGGGFVVNGRPWHGVLGMAGELGHMTVIPEGRTCPCGNHGCLVAAREQDQALTSRTVHTCAQAGDPAAQRIFAAAGTALGIALANLINAFNLPVYVIGGGVSRAWDQFSPAMFQELTERSIVFRAGEEQKRSHRATEVKPAQLRDRAGLIGAARLPMIMQPGRCCSLAV
jgi:glucokinase